MKAKSRDFLQKGSIMGDNLSSDDCTEQLIAALKGGEENYSLVQELLGREDVDVNSKSKYGGVTALEQACLSGRVKLVQLLIAHGASVYRMSLL